LASSRDFALSSSSGSYGLRGDISGFKARRAAVVLRRLLVRLKAPRFEAGVRPAGCVHLVTPFDGVRRPVGTWVGLQNTAECCAEQLHTGVQDRRRSLHLRAVLVVFTCGAREKERKRRDALRVSIIPSIVESPFSLTRIIPDCRMRPCVSYLRGGGAQGEIPVNFRKAVTSRCPSHCDGRSKGRQLRFSPNLISYLSAPAKSD